MIRRVRNIFGANLIDIRACLYLCCLCAKILLVLFNFCFVTKHSLFSRDSISFASSNDILNVMQTRYEIIESICMKNSEFYPSLNAPISFNHIFKWKFRSFFQCAFAAYILKFIQIAHNSIESIVD